MKQTIRFSCLLILFALISFCSLAQDSPVGVWKTIDDNTGVARSHIEIYEKGGKYYGKILKLLEEGVPETCPECPGDKKGKPLIGMEILWDMKDYKDYWSYGKIMDPENGKIYKCNIYLEEGDKLRVRGYVGFAAIGRNQYWHRVKS